MIPLHLYSTLGRKKALFVPRTAGAVQLYVCGITPYDYSHLGHARSYVSFDVLVRFLHFLGYDVTYVRNVTDIDDKLLAKAAAEGSIMSWPKIAAFFTADFRTQLAALNCLPPTLEPLATESIDAICALIERLMQKKFAYVAGTDVYFDVTKMPTYGKLSGKKLEDLVAGARVEVSAIKRHPADFVLWKGNTEGLFWESPWGFGRPGWHIECSAMIKKHLGTTIDIHCGGLDLIFPHHENEIAQSESAFDQPLAQYWLHNEFINIGKEKMSKSLGNFVSLHEALKKIAPAILRFFLIQHHYRTPIDYSDDSIAAAQTTLSRLTKILEHGEPAVKISDVVESLPHTDLLSSMTAALGDDLNLPRMWGIFFEHAAAIKQSRELAGLVSCFIREVCGQTLLQPVTQTITPEIAMLLAERETARRARDWARADAIRDQLIRLGIDVQDTKL